MGYMIGDPNKFEEANVSTPTLTYQKVLSDEIAVMDSTAKSPLCKDNNIPIMVLMIFFKKGNISNAVAGESIGSFNQLRPLFQFE